MSEDEIRQFYENGFIGPFDAFSREEMADFRKEMLAMEKRELQDLRLRHAARSALRNAAAVELHEAPGHHRTCRPDSWVRTCSCWRTQLFYKPPRLAGHSVAPGQHVHGRRLPGSGHLPARSQRDLPAHRVGRRRRRHARERLPALRPRHAQSRFARSSSAAKKASTRRPTRWSSIAIRMQSSACR